MQKARISTLGTKVAALERGTVTHRIAASLPFELDTADRHLPLDGLMFGAVHEIAGAGPEVEYGAAPALFAAGLLGRRPGPVLWILCKHDLFSKGLTQAGLDPGRLILGGVRRNRCSSGGCPEAS